jgi:AcrR family transcriptional regulator
MSPTTATTATTPAALSRRQRVHAAVRELMAEQGFRVSMDAVALRVGCSKQTLYADFGSKQALMRSVVQEHMDLSTARLGDADADLRQTLVDFAMQHAARLSDPTIVTTCQLLIAEASAFPEQAQALYRDGLDTLQQRLADWLEQRMQRGELRREAPRPAAELLLSMVVGLEFERRRFAVAHRQSDAQRRQWAEFSVDAFLRALAPAAVHTPSPSKTT